MANLSRVLPDQDRLASAGRGGEPIVHYLEQGSSLALSAKSEYSAARSSARTAA